MQENFAILNQGATLERTTFPIELLLIQVPEPRRDAILDCRVIHKIVRVLQEAFLNEPPAQAGLSSTIFNNSKNLASSQELRPDTIETTRRESEM